ncbi:MAG: arginine--tRNA ligase [Planctomycetes bacterium]|nr:arginine--tRNA ligase [Planctomycetota bacterium]
MSIATEPNPLLKALIARLAAAAKLPQEQVAGLLRPPPKPDMGDYAIPCHALAKARGAKPDQVAIDLAAELALDPALKDIVAALEPAGAFLNVRVNGGALCAAILPRIAAAGAAYGGGAEGAGQTVVVDYSSPNIAKPFHTGHLMTTVLGASLVRIYRALGYRVVGVNHLGDWGTQCGYQFLAWQRADPQEREKQLAARGIDYLVDLYVGINAPAKELAELKEKLLDKNVALQPDCRKELETAIAALEPQVAETDRRARELFKQLEDGDAELRALWERMRVRTLEVLQLSYDRLGVKFESTDGEGFFEPFLKPMIAELKQKGVLVQSEGAWVIELAEPGAKKKAPPFIVVKSDGATKYETRDLAAAIYRKQTYDFAQNLYVVDVRQGFHFSGLFKALEKCGYPWAKDCRHVSYGLMQIKEGDATLPMTTRGGRMIPLSELLDRMVGIVRGIVDEKNPTLPSERKAAVAEAVGVGAIVFWIQARRRNSNIVFDWKEATNPDGDTGPYVQYTHARACSILRKHGASIPPNAQLALLAAPAEVQVVKALDEFPRVVRDAAREYEPSMLATWLVQTSRLFNDFYNSHQVLKAESEALRDARLALVDAVRTVLARGLALLGLGAPEEM